MAQKAPIEKLADIATELQKQRVRFTADGDDDSALFCRDMARSCEDRVDALAKAARGE